MRGWLGRAAARLAAAAEIGSLPSASHRPWPLPSRPWIMAQTWSDLLFAHWPISPPALERLIPDGLALDTFGGAAWVSITPFVITGLRPRALPAIAGLSTFPEINVRTYVNAGGKPGVWFFSLDAGSRLAVAAARLLYALPYRYAAFSIGLEHESIRYHSRRPEGGPVPAEFCATYRSTEAPQLASPGSLAAWLTERYCLYAADRARRLFRAEIHHPPWPLASATATIDRNTMTAALGFELPDASPILQFAKRLDVQVWSPERVR